MTPWSPRPKAMVKRDTGREEKLLFKFQFPPNGVSWYVMKSGEVWAESRAAARKELVQRGVLEPFEARVAEVVRAEP